MTSNVTCALESGVGVLACTVGVYLVEGVYTVRNGGPGVGEQTIDFLICEVMFVCRHRINKPFTMVMPCGYVEPVSKWLYQIANMVRYRE
jgi:hypothetical protein